MSDMVCGRLRELRKKNGYTQSGLAKALGVSQSTVGNWEAGIRRPNLDTLEPNYKYCPNCGCKMDLEG